MKFGLIFVAFVCVALGLESVAARENDLRTVSSLTNELDLSVESLTTTRELFVSFQYEFNLWVTHGVLMAVAFGLLLPVGTLFPAMACLRNRKGRLWFLLHRGTMIVFVIIALIGFIIALVNVEMVDQSLVAFPHRTYVHSALGIALIILVFCQFLAGLFRPHLPEQGAAKSTPRKIFEFVHPTIGRSMVVLAAVQIWYGYYNISQIYIVNPYQRNAVLTWGYVHAIAMPIIYFAFLLYFKFQSGHWTLNRVMGKSGAPNADAMHVDQDQLPVKSAIPEKSGMASV